MATQGDGLLMAKARRQREQQAALDELMGTPTKSPAAGAAERPGPVAVPASPANPHEPPTATGKSPMTQGDMLRAAKARNQRAAKNSAASF